MYDWNNDLYYVTGALSSDDCLEITQERVDDLAYRAAEIIVDENLADDLDYYSCDRFAAVRSEYEDFLSGGASTLWAIPLDSELYSLLVKWYDNDEDVLAHSVRSFFEDDDNMYFVTGCGYDIMSADLLGGNADGIARRDFDGFVDSQNL